MAARERKGGGSYGWFFKSQREWYIDLYGIHVFAVKVITTASCIILLPLKKYLYTVVIAPHFSLTLFLHQPKAMLVSFCL